MTDSSDVVVNVPSGRTVGVHPTNGMKKVASEAEFGNGTPVVFKVRPASSLQTLASGLCFSKFVCTSLSGLWSDTRNE